jgi:hypothetical protein
MRLLIAILSSLVGLALLFGGYRLARIIIPIMGFLSGMSLGGAVIANTASTPFLGTVLGIVVGITFGLVFAILAYMYYYAAVIILTAGLGYWAGSGLVLWLGFKPGVLSAVLGIVMGVVVGYIAVRANAPKYALIIITSVAGAITAIGGVLLLFHKIPLEIYSYTSARIVVGGSFFWTLSALALFMIGVAVQTQTSRYYENFNEWAVGEHGEGKMPPSVTPHPSS